MRIKSFVFTFILLLLFAVPAGAAEPVAAKIPVLCQMGDSSAEYVYTITAEDPGAPAPQKDTLTLRNGQSGEFEISCSTIGTWHYRITQEKAGAADSGDSVKPYHVILYVGSNEDGTLFLEATYYQEGSASKAASCIFSAEPEKETEPKKPETEQRKEPETEPKKETEPVPPIPPVPPAPEPEPEPESQKETEKNTEKETQKGTEKEDGLCSLTIEKNDVGRRKARLSGAVLQLFDEDGNELARWRSGSEAKVISGLKRNANYRIHELSVPSGYEREPNGDILIRIDEAGKATILNGAGDMKRDGTIQVLNGKKNTAWEQYYPERYREVQGADREKKKDNDRDRDGEKLGEYRDRQKDTEQDPAILSALSVRTGDETPILPWIIAMAVSLAGIAASAFVFRARHRNHRH